MLSARRLSSLFFLTFILGACDCGSSPELFLFSVTPDEGPVEGGNVVTLAGGGFEDGMEVFFGDEASPSVTVLGVGAAEVVVPAGVGTVDVRVVTSRFESSLFDAYRFLDAPEVLAIRPGSGPTDGGQMVVVEGAGFVDGSVVVVGGRVASEPTFVDAGTLMALTPPGPPGFADVSVLNPSGGSGTLSNGYQYVALDRCIASIEPDFGATEIPASARLELQWDTAMVLDDLSVDLRTVGGESLATTVTVIDDRSVEVTPMRPLRFWETYTLEVGAVRAVAGYECAGEATVFSTVRPEEVPQPTLAAPAVGVDAADDTAYTVTGRGQHLQIWDVGDPEAAPTLLHERDLGGTATAVRADGDRLYTSLGYDGVAVFDISSRRAPRRLGIAGTPGYARTVVPLSDGSQRWIAVADGAEGIRFLDVTESEYFPDAGVIRFGPEVGEVIDLALSGSELAFASRSHYGWIDVSDPTAATLANVSAEPVGREVAAVTWIDARYLALLERRFGLAVIDTTTNSETDRHPLPADVGWERMLDAVPTGDGGLEVAGGRSGIIHFAAAGAGMLTRTGTTPTPADLTRVHRHGGRLLVGDQAGLLALTDGAESLLRGPEHGHGDTRDVTVGSAGLFAAADLRGLRTMVPSTTEAEVFEAGVIVATDAVLSTEGAGRLGPSSLLLADDQLVVGDGGFGLALFDVTDPLDPIARGKVEFGDYVQDMARLGDLVFVCDDNEGMWVADVSDPNAPLLRGTFGFPDAVADKCRDIAIRDSFIYLASREALTIIDASDPASPTQAARLSLPADDDVRSLTVSRDRLITLSSVENLEGQGARLTRLQIFDISSGSTIERLYLNESLPGDGGDVMVFRELLFVALGRAGIVQVYDVRDGTAPLLQGVIDVAGTAGRLSTDGEALFVAKRQAGAGVIRTGPLPLR